MAMEMRWKERETAAPHRRPSLTAIDKMGVGICGSF